MITISPTRCLAFSLLAATSAVAQTAPVCPINPYITLAALFAPGAGPPVSDRQILLLISQFITATEIWNYVIQDVVVSGNQIAGSAPGVRRPIGPGAPNQYGVFGPVPAGDYTITVQPIATNVTPNVNCPLLTIPLTVRQGNEATPVPGITGRLATLLAGLLACIAALALRLRRRVR